MVGHRARLRAVDRGPGWQWTKVSVIHPPGADSPAGKQCTGDIHSYVYRHYRPESASYHRCIGLSWCTGCRAYTGTMVHVPRDRALVDALAGLPPHDRERLHRSEVRLLDYLDRLVRRGTWPPDMTSVESATRRSQPGGSPRHRRSGR